MHDIRFEEVKEEHLPALLEIYNYYVSNSTATFHIEPIGLDEMKGIVFFDNPKYKAYAIIDDRDICGYCILCPFKKREAYDITAEVTIYIRHDHAGLGIGSAAIRHLENLAAKNGIHSLIAVICGENTASIRLFEKNGYEKCGHLREVGMKFGRMLDVVYYEKII